MRRSPQVKPKKPASKKIKSVLAWAWTDSDGNLTGMCDASRERLVDRCGSRLYEDRDNRRRCIRARISPLKSPHRKR